MSHGLANAKVECSIEDRHNSKGGVLNSAQYIVMDPLKSNSMKSKNPHSGFHFEQVSQCLDTSTQNPIRNAGGGMIIYRIKRKKPIAMK